MRLEREEVVFILFFAICVGVMLAHVVNQPDVKPLEQKQVRSDAPDSDDQRPLGPMDIPGAASWSGDEPGKDGKEQ